MPTLTDRRAENRAMAMKTAAEEARALRDHLLTDAGVGTWRFDPDADVYQFSPELMQGYEDNAPTVPREMLDALCHPDDLAIEQPIRERITREGGSGQIELRMKVPGQPGWRHMRVLMRSGRQTPSGRYEMYGLSQVITDWAQARDDARANAERLRIALSAASAGAFEIDYAEKTMWNSPEFEAMIGRKATFEEANGSWDDMLHPDDRPLMRAMAGRWGQPGGEAVEVRTLIDGKERWVRICCDIQWVDGRPVRCIGLVLDVDERKRQELALIEAQKAAAAATAAKSDFLASVSHEIRTPMNGIVGVLHLMKNEAISEGGRKLLEEALACSGMLSQLINDVLDFSKIEAGKLELAPEPTQVVDTLEGVIDLLSPQAEARGLYLRASVEPGLDWVMVDPIRLRQCLFNLIGNAVKFTLEGGAEVRLMRSPKDAGRIRFEVEDTGVGIARAAAPRVFGRFEQADHATTRNFNGTGLGLAISRSLARMMGGDIDFESQEGRGTTFRLELEAPATSPVETEAAAAEGATLEGLKLLLVDDNATNRLIGVKVLESLGADTASCEDGPSAIEAVALGGYDLVLMDVNMPDMDGIEATRRIRALGGEAGRIPVLALTANVMAHQRQSYLAAGMDGVVPKPFSPALLLAEIARLVAPAELEVEGSL